MKYETFINELKSLGFTLPEAPKKKTSDYYGYSSLDLYGGIVLYHKEPALILSWCTGGITGGSCWGGENHAYSSGEVEPDWEDLDRILEHFCPNITHLKYKAVMRSSTTDDYEVGEYYGNSRNYALRVMKIKDLWEVLNEKKLFENDPERDEDE